ncbi:hypothetical protein GRAN_4861 [Granulicella sibirica]|uniref:Uncharacterized protein n=1 Tax=Granulicella sibirica TaxID=2479048 RepID=A0A4Q0SWB6_9BACT|nr:hypothetical protein GRAN_4861 [Granulicella sibirica]
MEALNTANAGGISLDAYKRVGEFEYAINQTACWCTGDVRGDCKLR